MGIKLALYGQIDSYHSKKPLIVSSKDPLPAQPYISAGFDNIDKSHTNINAYPTVLVK